MTASAYASISDVAGYLPTATLSVESANWTILLNIASRAIDRFCDRYFYSNGASTKYFDGDGSAELYVPRHDFYTLTALKIALNENNDPSDSTQWYTIHGDGITPPSNFYLEPSNRREIGSVTDQTLLEPFYRIVIPTNPWSGTTNDYLTVFTAGRRTVAITASWGWPAIPDDIKDVCIKLVIRMWRAKESGQANNGPPADFGMVMIARYLDPGDIEILHSYRRDRVV